MSSLDLTASLPGSALARCGQSDTTGQQPVPIPRPIPGSSRLPEHARSESPVVLQTTSGADAGTSLGHRHRADVTARESPPVTKQRVRRTHKQLSLSTHSLPRQATASTTRTLLEGEISAGGSGILPPPSSDDNSLAGISGSRPRLRRYASTSAYSSTPSLDPVILVRPRSRTGSRRGSYYRSNTLGRTSFDQEQYCSATSVEMEGNYYTLQTRRGGGRGIEAAGEGREESPVWTHPAKLASSKEDIVEQRAMHEDCRTISYRMPDNYNYGQMGINLRDYVEGQESIV